LTRKNPFSTGPAEGKTIHPIPFADREHIHKRTSPAHDFIFEQAQYRSVYDDPQASSTYTHMQEMSDIYDRDGILRSSLVGKGRYVDLYL
jgi:hypothetical protein